MAVTIEDIPVASGETIVPGYSKQVFVVSSDKTAEDNFNFICDIYITGVSSPSYFRIRKPVEPGTTYGVYDVHRIIEDYISHDIDKDTYDVQALGNSFASYLCKFGEEFGASSSGVTAYPDQAVSDTFFANNMALDFIDRKDYTEDAYTMTTSTQADFLTNAPQSGWVAYTEDAWLGIQTNSDGAKKPVDYIQIQSYDADGVSQKIVQIDNIYASFPGESSRFLACPSGPNNLNQIAAGRFQLGSQPVIATDTAKYYLQCFDVNGVAVSSQYWYTIDAQCTPHEVWRFHFLNKLGRFDSFSFTRASRQRSAVERKHFRKKLGSQSGGAWSYNKKDRSKIAYNTVAQDRITVNSDWVSADTSDWLRELMESPVVYYDDGTSLIAVNIVDDSYEKRRHENDTIFNIIMTFEWSYNRKLQRE